MIKSHKCKTMNLKKVVSFVSEVLEPHIEIPVPIGITVLTEEHVQAFFKENPKATHVRIPKGIRRISNKAFISQPIISVVGLQNIVSIGELAFFGCKSLTMLEGANNLKIIYRGAFQYCNSLKTLKELNSLTTIGDEAFLYCKSLETLGGLSSLTVINRGAFDGCERLTTLNGLNRLKIIWNFAFYQCKRLTMLEGLDSLTTIGNYAFQECSDLTTLKGLSSLKVIGDFTFMRCYRLQNISGLETVEKVGMCTFFECFKLDFLEFSNGLSEMHKTAFDQAFNCKLLVPRQYVTALRNQHANWIRRTNFNEATSFEVFDLENNQDVKAFNRLESVVKYKLPLYFSKKQFELDKELYSRESKEFITTVLMLMNRLNNQVVHESILNAPIEMWFLILSFITRTEMNPERLW